MLQNIHIQNFRCFEDFEASGFERINLIGGKNNSGKTCLLEGIGAFSYKFKFGDLVNLRGNQAYQYRNFNHLYDNTFINGELKDGSLQFDDEYPPQDSIGKLDLFFIQHNIEIPKINILESFDKFDEKLIKYKIIEILQNIDKRIEDVRTFKTKEGLWLKKYNEEYQPIEFYGDAIKNVIRYFTPFFEKSLNENQKRFQSYILIDEIENGIHYSAHYDFWKNIFKLSKELNVQVFATTHSLEMIQQFNEVAKEEGEGGYFELSREFETGKIFAQKHEVDLLEYELLKTESTIRG